MAGAGRSSLVILAALVVALAGIACSGGAGPTDCVPNEIQPYPAYFPRAEGGCFDVPTVPYELGMYGSPQPGYDVAGLFQTHEDFTAETSAEILSFYEEQLDDAGYESVNKTEESRFWSARWQKGEQSVLVAASVPRSKVVVYLCPPATGWRCGAKSRTQIARSLCTETNGDVGPGCDPV